MAADPDRFLQMLTDGVHRFEGRVNQYTGDGIMALFGATIARGSLAERAAKQDREVSSRRYFFCSGLGGGTPIEA